MATPAEIQLIRERLELADFIQGYLKLKRTGRNFSALCPFHGEKTPSFFVSPERQIWHCFGCNRGGDIFTFLMEREGIDFNEALNYLAEKAHVKLTRRTGLASTSKKEQLYQVLTETLRYYQAQLLNTASGQEALRYLARRNISQESIIRFKLGYAPNAWEATLRTLQNKGLAPSLLEEAGLIIARQQEGRGGYYDRFRHRVIFPIFDALDRVVGFSGRALDEASLPKYLNSPDSVVFQKGKLLYGLTQAKARIKEKDTAILVEGNLDVISLHQHQIQTAVAPLGTALTQVQLRQLKLVANNLLFCFDRDAAGEEAVLRALRLGIPLGLNIKVACLDFAKDPDEAVHKDPQAFKKIVLGAKDMLEYLFEVAQTRFLRETKINLRGFTQFVLPFVALEPAQVVKETYVQQLARFLGVGEAAIWEDLQRIKPGRDLDEGAEGAAATAVAPGVAPKKKSRHLLLGEQILLYFLSLPKAYQQHSSIINQMQKVKANFFSDHDLRTVWQMVQAQLTFAGPFDINRVAEGLAQSSRQRFDLLNLQASATIPSNERQIVQQLTNMVGELHQLFLHQQIRELRDKLKEAEKKHQMEQVQEVKKQLRELTKELK